MTKEYLHVNTIYLTIIITVEVGQSNFLISKKSMYFY